jgi:uncharacterized Zn ribbon protein
MNLKVCPYSPSHVVYGGNPEYVCSDCATEWRIVEQKGRKSVLYMHFNSKGEVIKKWKVPYLEGVSQKKRRLSA